MLEWISGNSQAINAFINLCMLAVWIAYLQVFIWRYKRQRRPKILINVGSGPGIETRCLVSNMSSEAIYIQSIVIEDERSGVRHSASVTELDQVETWERASDVNLWSRQGPLRAGEIRDMGSFKSILEHVLSVRSGGRRDIAIKAPQVEAVKVTVCAVYASEDLLVGAWRRFRIISDNGAATVHPETVGTVQIRSRRQRRELETLLESV